MAYADVGGLAGDPGYISRLIACCTEQAGVFINDARPEYIALARAVINSPDAATWFAWPVASSPGFGDAFAGGGSASITDAMLLSAVQALWPTIAAAHPELTP